MSRTLPILSVTLAAALVAPTVHANMASPRFTPGDRVGEPVLTVAHGHVIEEELLLDLHAIAEPDGLARVLAVYRIRWEGPAGPVPVRFVGPDIERPAVFLDDEPVLGLDEVVDAETLPDSWWAPETVESVAGGPASYRTERPRGVVDFTLDLTPGEHTIRVGYQARAATFDGRAPHREHQLAYVLAPARDWASFGHLSVTVRAPSGWEVATSPALDARGCSHTGQFEGLPADALTVSLRKPAPTPAGWPPLAVGLVLGLTAALVIGRELGRRGTVHTRRWPLRIALGLLTVAGFAATAAATVFATEYALRVGLDPHELSQAFDRSRLLSATAAAVLAAVASGPTALAVVAWYARAAKGASQP